TAIVACGVAVFYTHRSAHGTTAEERTAYEIGEKAGEKAPRGATLPTEAELNMTAQKYFEAAGPGSTAPKSYASSRPAGFPKGLHRRVRERRLCSSEPLMHRKPLKMDDPSV